MRATEARACATLSADDRAIGPFEHAAEIAGVAPLVRKLDVRTAGSRERQLGAVVTFRAVPGLSVEWLQRLVDCHLARNAALGNDQREMPDDPLALRGTQAHVTSAGTGFAVEITSDDADTAREILARARRAAQAANAGR